MINVEIISKLHKKHPGTWMVIPWSAQYTTRSRYEVFTTRISDSLPKLRDQSPWFWLIYNMSPTNRFPWNSQGAISLPIRYLFEGPRSCEVAIHGEKKNAQPSIPSLSFGTLGSSQQGLVLGFRLAGPKKKLAPRPGKGWEHSGKIRYDGKIHFIQSEMIDSGKLA